MEAVKDYIFINYSRDDLPKVTPIVEEMRNSGYNVWYDANILPGEDWTDHIASRIANCAVCVAFHSQTSRDSPHCREEIHYAIKHGKTVISVYLEDVTLKEGLDMQLARFQSVRYTNSAKLLKDLRKSPEFEYCRFDVSPKWWKGINIKRWVPYLKQGLQIVLVLLVSLVILILIFLFQFPVLTSHGNSNPFWFLDENGVLDIISPPFFKVEMPDYSYKPDDSFFPPPWAAKTPIVKCAVIRKDIIHIGDSSFQNCSNMKFVIIPKGVTSIGAEAFSGCTVLKQVQFPNSIQIIGNLAFADCVALEDVTIPESVTSIGEKAFSGCKSLKEINFPSSLDRLDSSVFQGCTSLKQIQFSDDIRAIGALAFADCVALEDITIPDGIFLIVKDAFSGCANLKTVRIQSAPERVKIIEDWDSFWDTVKHNESYFSDCSDWDTFASAVNAFFSDPDGTMYISATAFDPDTEIIYEPPVSDADVS